MFGQIIQLKVPGAELTPAVGAAVGSADPVVVVVVVAATGALVPEAARPVVPVIPGVALPPCMTLLSASRSISLVEDIIVRQSRKQERELGHQ